MVAGGAVDLDEVAQPEVLDPRGVEGEHSGSPKFLECSHGSRRSCDCQPPGQASFARPLRVLWRIMLRQGSAEPSESAAVALWRLCGGKSRSRAADQSGVSLHQ